MCISQHTFHTCVHMKTLRKFTFICQSQSLMLMSSIGVPYVPAPAPHVFVMHFNVIVTQLNIFVTQQPKTMATFYCTNSKQSCLSRRTAGLSLSNVQCDWQLAQTANLRY